MSKQQGLDWPVIPLKKSGKSIARPEYQMTPKCKENSIEIRRHPGI